MKTFSYTASAISYVVHCGPTLGKLARLHVGKMKTLWDAEPKRNPIQLLW